MSRHRVDTDIEAARVRAMTQMESNRQVKFVEYGADLDGNPILYPHSSSADLLHGPPLLIVKRSELRLSLHRI